MTAVPPGPRRLGTTAVRVTELSFGGAAIGNLFTEVSDEAAAAAVAAAWDGVICTEVGRLLEQASPPYDRDSEGFAGPATCRRVRDYSARGVRRSVQASLDRLGLDRIDVPLIHDPDDHREQALREAYPALERGL